MKKKSIGILVGSLRRDSFSKKAATYLAEQLEDRFDVDFIDLSSLAIYNPDIDNDDDMPEGWRSFRKEVIAADAVLFVTPEYNRSMPAVLKNALDIGSRPFSESAWYGKPGAIISISQGKTGGFGGNHHMRQTAACLNINMMQQPEAYIGGITELVDESGVSDSDAQAFFQKFANAYADWVNRFVS